MALTVIISCGGNSQRMGVDKSLLNYHNLSQREYIFNMLRPVFDSVFLSLNRNQNSSLPYFTDDVEFERHGPISGLLTAMKRIPGNDIMLLGCDYPAISLSDIQQFLTSANREKPAAFYNPGSGFYEPVLAYYPASCYSRLLNNFNSGKFSLQYFLKEVNAVKFIPENIVSMKSIDDPLGFEKANVDFKLSSQVIRIKKIDNGVMTEYSDQVAVEEPLEIKLTWLQDGKINNKCIAVTMRTPGNDPELARGFLFTENIINNTDQLREIRVTAPNEVMVTLAEGFIPVLTQADRNFYTTSSCGVCGKSSIDHIKVFSGAINSHMTIPAGIISGLPQLLRQHQALFNDTGGLHACALFNNEGNIIMIREDVGRHNALDKLLGACIQNMELPLDNCILLLSGRASFELIQKAAMCGIPVVAAIGAPSSLAINLADECGITLAGFVKETRLNIYTAAQRITNYQNENQN